MKHSKAIMYADDTVMYISGKVKEDIKRLLEEDLMGIKNERYFLPKRTLDRNVSCLLNADQKQLLVVLFLFSLIQLRKKHFT